MITIVLKHVKAFGEIFKEITADSGYFSKKNLLYLKEHNIESYIKLQDHERRKSRAYKENIEKYYNLTAQVFENEYYYICHDGRELRHIRTETKEMEDYTQTLDVYGCADCSGCEHEEKCTAKITITSINIYPTEYANAEQHAFRKHQIMCVSPLDCHNAFYQNAKSP